MSDFQCSKCNKLFRVHTFILMRHPSQAKCPKCDSKGNLTEQGREHRSSRFHAINQTHQDYPGNPKGE